MSTLGSGLCLHGLFGDYCAALGVSFAVSTLGCGLCFLCRSSDYCAALGVSSAILTLGCGLCLHGRFGDYCERFVCGVDSSKWNLSSLSFW